MTKSPSPVTASPGREVYLDNLRVFLTVLVVFHHAAVTYGAPGGWYYSEPLTGGLVPGLLLTLFVSTNQSYFMGLFFFLSAYFVLPSLLRKGAVTFVLDRLKRLGIPLIVYSLVLTPVIITVLHWGEGVGFMRYAVNRESWIQVGVLWFTSALLFFTIIYVILYTAGVLRERSIVLPGDGTVVLLGLFMGIVSFLIRIVYPIGETVTAFGYQPAHFTQYVVLFILGFVAYRNRWLDSLTYERGRKWLWISVAIIFIGMPCLFVLREVTHVETAAFLGGGTIQSFANAVWEQVLGVSLIMAWLGTSKVWWPQQGRLMKGMSRAAYAVYIIHPLVLVTVSVLIRDLALPSLVKFIVSGSVAAVASFLVATLLVRLPFVRNVV